MIHIVVGAIFAAFAVAGIVSGIIHNETNIHRHREVGHPPAKRPAITTDYIDGFFTAEVLNHLDDMFK